MWRKAVIVLALSLSAGAAELTPFFGAALGAHCTDQVCFCPRHRAPTPQAKPHCHDDQAPSPSTEISAACQHQEPAAPAPAAARPRVLPVAAALAAPGFITTAILLDAAAPAAGHLRHELPPPRSFA
jgi:hypothetical protein